MALPPQPAPGQHVWLAGRDRVTVNVQPDAYVNAWFPGELTSIRTTPNAQVLVSVEYWGSDGLPYVGTFPTRQIRD